VKFIAPNEETVARSRQVAETVLADAEARQYVAAIGYHCYPYGSPYASVKRILKESAEGKPDHREVEERRQLRELAARHQLPLWMTEVSHPEVPAYSPIGERPGGSDFAQSPRQFLVRHVRYKQPLAGGKRLWADIS
jgi:O-glycosyl hydrolase